MSDLGTIAWRHADEVHDAVADARLPQLDTGRKGVPRPAWAVVAVVVILLTFSLPVLFGSDQPGLEVPVVATTIPGPDIVETSTVTVGAGGAFIPTGSMTWYCSWCPGVLLDDGRVLILGMSWAEIYDPVNWTFNVVEARPLQRIPGLVDAVLLRDGRVLVVGPPAYERAPQTVEIFDPSNGTFRSIERPRGDGRAAVRLADGRVLIVGGALFGIPAQPTIFDPVLETFTDTGPPSVEDHIDALMLDDGRVLVFGWEGETELYDPGSGTFTPTGSMITARSGFTVTKLADGRVLVVGGNVPWGRHAELASAELYDPDTGAFSQTGSMAKERVSHTAALLPDGRVLVIGGGWSDPETQATAEIYDPATGLFTGSAPLTTRRLASTAVPLADGTVLIFGHYPGNNSMTGAGSKSAEIFTLASIEPPVGCCDENPTVFEVTADIGPEPGRASLVVPPGGLEGATEASFEYFYGDSSGGVGEVGELTLPQQCAKGCVVLLPDFGAGPVEIGYEGTVTVQIAYEGSAPDESSMIMLVFEPGVRSR